MYNLWAPLIERPDSHPCVSMQFVEMTGCLEKSSISWMAIRLFKGFLSFKKGFLDENLCCKTVNY